MLVAKWKGVSQGGDRSASPVLAPTPVLAHTLKVQGFDWLDPFWIGGGQL